MHSFGTQEEEKKAVVNRIIPRLREVYLCGVISQKMQDEDELFSSASLELGDLKLSFGSETRALTDPILDSGIIMVRVMLQMFGYTVRKSDRKLQGYTSQVNDITINSFSSLEQKPSKDETNANYIFDGLESSKIEAIKNVVLKTNDGVAHLTANETKSICLGELSLACTSIIDLVNSWLIIPLGMEAVKFSFEVSKEQAR